MTDWIEISALVGGPVLAVALTLWREQVRQRRERQLAVMRQLLTTRHFADDPAFTAAVKLIPIEYGHIDSVMTAWENFERIANQKKLTGVELVELLKQMMLHLGYNERAASQAAASNYVSVGLADQHKLNEGVLKGVLSIAEASQRNAHASKFIAEHITGKPLPPI